MRLNLGTQGTHLGRFRRTSNGRFLYGRAKNYRLAPCLAGLPDANPALGSAAPTAGASPLTVTHTVAAGSQSSIAVGQRDSWPSQDNAPASTSAFLAQGGIATRDTLYARNNGSTPQAESVDWIYGDGGSDLDVGFGSNTNHDYVGAGTYTPDLTFTNALGQAVTEEDVETIVVS